MTAAQLSPMLSSIFGANVSGTVAPLYPVALYPSPWWTLVNVMTDALILCPATHVADTLSRRGSGPYATRTSPVFVYYFTHVLEVIALFMNPIRTMNATHGTELIPVFGYDFLMWGAGEPALAGAMSRYWMRFAVGGDPNGGSDPAWSAYNTANRTVAQLDVASDGSGANITMLTGGVRMATCDEWWKLQIPQSKIWG